MSVGYGVSGFVIPLVTIRINMSYAKEIKRWSGKELLKMRIGAAKNLAIFGIKVIRMTKKARQQFVFEIIKIRRKYLFDTGKFAITRTA